MKKWNKRIAACMLVSTLLAADAGKYYIASETADTVQAEAVKQTETNAQNNAAIQNETNAQTARAVQTDAVRAETDVQTKTAVSSEIYEAALQTETYAQTEAALQSVWNAESEIVVQTEMYTQAETADQVETHTQSEAVIHAETHTQSEAVIHAETYAQSEADIQAETYAQSEADIQAETYTQSEAVIQTETNTQSETAPQIEMDAQSEAAVQDENMQTDVIIQGETDALSADDAENHEKSDPITASEALDTQEETASAFSEQNAILKLTITGDPCVICIDTDQKNCSVHINTNDHTEKQLTFPMYSVIHIHCIDADLNAENCAAYESDQFHFNAVADTRQQDSTEVLFNETNLSEKELILDCDVTEIHLHCQSISRSDDTNDILSEGVSETGFSETTSSVCESVSESDEGESIGEEESESDGNESLFEETESDAEEFDSEETEEEKYPVILNGDSAVQIILPDDHDRRFSPGEQVNAKIVASQGYAVDEIEVTSDGQSVNDYEMSAHTVESTVLSASEQTISYELDDSLMSEVEISFIMPAAPVLLAASSTPLKDDAGISKITVDYIVNPGTSTRLPSTFEAPGNRLMGTYFKIFFYDESGKIITFPDGRNYRWGQCLDPGATDPVAEYSKDNLFLEGDSDAMFTALKSNSLLAKAFYYLYDGPAFGHSIDSVNLEDMFESWGCTEDGQKFALSRWIMVRAYEGKNFTDRDAFSDEGLSRIEEVIELLKSFPTPDCSFSVTNANAVYKPSQDIFVSETITYDTFPDNKITLTLPDGITLVKSNGDRYTESVTLKGGAKFHLEKAGANKSSKSTLKGTPVYASDYYGITLNNTGKQTVGFSYYGTSKLSLSVTWPDRPHYLTLVKQSKAHGSTVPNSNYSLAGAVYEIYDPDHTKVGTLTTKADGTTSVLEVTKTGTYTAKEITAPKGYKLSSAVLSVKVSDSHIQSSPATVLAYDEEIKGYITVKKTCDTQKYASIKAFLDKLPLTGAVYGIYDSTGKEIQTITIGADGTAKSSALEMGTYKVKEKTAPSGYQTDLTSHAAVINSSNLNVSITSAEEPIFGKADLYKYTEANANGESDPSGYRFRLVSATDSTLYIDFPATDQNGYTVKDMIPVGTYRLEELNLKNEYSIPSLPTNITIKAYRDSSDITHIGTKNDPIINAPVEYSMIIRKIDAETGGPLKDAVFEIVPFKNKTEGKALTLTVEKGRQVDATHFATDNNGMITFKEKLKGGNYLLRETDAPENYTIASPVVFAVNRSSTEVSVTVKDTPYQNKIRVKKTVPNHLQAQSAMQLSAENASFNSTEQKYDHSGFIFTITAAENITDQNGNIRKIGSKSLTAGTLIESITTNADGDAQSSNLYCGKYKLTETQINPISGLIQSTREILFTVSEKTDPISAVKEYAFQNDWNLVRIHKTSTDTGSDLGGIEFSCSRTDKNASVLKAKTDANGILYFGGLAQGTYEIRETATLAGYNIDPDVTTFSVDSKGLINGKSVLQLERSNTPNIVYFHKYDIVLGKDSAELAGAHLELYDKKGTVIDSWISGEDGSDTNGNLLPHKIAALPAGDYTLRETICPEGYEHTVSEISFAIKDSMQIQQVNMANSPYRDVELSKRALVHSDQSSDPDAFDDAGELAGAAMTLTDSTGSIFDSWVSSDQPHMIKLPSGTYTLTESLPADGYTTEESVSFSVEKREKTGDFEITEVVMKDRPTVISVSKYDVVEGPDSHELAGAHLLILDEEGNVMEEWISGTDGSDENGQPVPHMIYGLPFGTYTLQETICPENYESITDSVTFTVTDTHDIQKVRMSNAPYRDVSISKISLVHSPDAQEQLVDGKELPGAHLEIRDTNDQLIDSWISGTEPHMLKLPSGTYTLSETLPADGYATAEIVQFSVTRREQEGDCEIVPVIMKDQPTALMISKLDIADGSPVEGAVLIITDLNGNEIERWETTAKPHMIHQLPVGDYELTEITAPEGYDLAETVSFRVEDDTRIQKVVMYDHRTPVNDESETQTDSEKPAETDSESESASETSTRPESETSMKESESESETTLAESESESETIATESESAPETIATEPQTSPEKQTESETVPQSETPQSPSQPNTGDPTNMILYVYLMAAALCVIGYTAYRKRH